eukprot:12256.XXX_274094_274201_1 [CDS] Oithona nana genome sequencing.
MPQGVLSEMEPHTSSASLVVSQSLPAEILEALGEQ